ncbi:hypothetical protein L218DRAFT_720618 [Marasmius fiardii PR-910]|nr:hypothetical protein L218DRAFT_720618 [Marasmius fiardii PR-910]
MTEGENSPAPVTTGIVHFHTSGRVFKTRYRVVGDLKTSKKRPVAILHGGPDMDYL